MPGLGGGSCYGLPHVTVSEPETGCTCSTSCTRGSIPRISRMCPDGLFQRIFGEYSVSPHPPYNPFSYPICGVRLLMVKLLFHLFLMERQADEQEPLSMWESGHINDKTVVPCWDTLPGKMLRQ